MSLLPKISNTCFNDLHELESSDYKWDLPFKKISIGNFHGSTASIDLGVVQMVEARLSGTLLQNGLTPPGYKTFAIPAIDSRAFWWHYRKVDHNHLLVFPENRKLKCISYDGFHVYTLSIQEQYLKTLCDTYGFTRVTGKLRGKEKVLPIAKPNIYLLNSMLQTLSLAIKLKGEEDFPEGLISTTREELCKKVLQLVEESDETENVPIKRDRDRTVLKALEYILDHDLQKISIEELVVKTGIKKRALEYAFQEYATVSPKRFIQALRLNNFREDIKQNMDQISDTAIRHGFTHHGQLARDYKLLFAEMPRDTLKRAMKNEESDI